jgi:hypothetical protein
MNEKKRGEEQIQEINEKKRTGEGVVGSPVW